MSITVVSAAPDQLLTTIAAVKTTLGISGSDQDAFLTDLVKAASDWAARYCGRVFGKETVTENLVGKGVPEILLSRTPVVSLSTVLYGTGAVTDVSITDAAAGVLFRLAGFTSSELSYNTISPHPSNYGEEKWHFTYVGGYVLPNWEVSGESRNLPYDLERAIISMAKTMYRNRDFDESAKSYKIGETTIQWNSVQAAAAEAGSSLPRMSKDVLDYYKRAF